MVYRKTMLSYFLLLLLLARSTIADLAANNVKKNIIILAGQSNISGRGGVIKYSPRPGVDSEMWDGIIPPECQSNSSILRLSGGLRWVEAQEPLHKDIDVNWTCGVGPGMSFANTVLKRDPSLGVIGLVPCAVGGTSITEWSPGSFLYNQLIRRTKAALRGGGKIRAMLWYQGESDTETPEGAKQYKVRLERFFKQVRYDLQIPTLPVIQVELATAQGPYIELVRKAQREINLENVRYVNAKGLQVGLDYVHLTTDAQARLGEMLADAFLRI